MKRLERSTVSWFVVMAVGIIIAGLAFGAGLAFFLLFALIPYLVTRLILRDQQIQYTRETLALYKRG